MWHRINSTEACCFFLLRKRHVFCFVSAYESSQTKHMWSDNTASTVTERVKKESVFPLMEKRSCCAATCLNNAAPSLWLCWVAECQRWPGYPPFPLTEGGDTASQCQWPQQRVETSRSLLFFSLHRKPQGHCLLPVLCHKLWRASAQEKKKNSPKCFTRWWSSILISIEKGCNFSSVQRAAAYSGGSAVMAFLDVSTGKNRSLLLFFCNEAAATDETPDFRQFKGDISPQRWDAVVSVWQRK